ncbi:hypothetical protein HanIR_Chr16g0824011 [Helianthus annuus]|nr:hypothetical protein HanIR_Chr16g0824011 [Helianthus annuus]
MVPHGAITHSLHVKRGCHPFSVTVLTSALKGCRWGPFFSTNQIFSSLFLFLYFFNMGL